jgi:hypothetical protein
VVHALPATIRLSAMKISFSTIDLVEDVYDEDYGPATTTISLYVCNSCGAVVQHRALHNDWHESIRLNRVIE